MTGAAPSRDDFALFDAAPCGLLQTRVDGLILLANRQFCSWLGRPREQLMNQWRLQDLMTVGARIFHQTHWAPLIAMQGSLSEVKLDFNHADGSTLPMVLNARRRVDGETTVVDVAAYVARDRDKYERELVLARRRLEASVAEATRLEAEARDRAHAAEQMIGIVSHDLRNPLASIRLGLALLERDLVEGQQRTLGRISRSADRASGLVSDLLDFTQARLGHGLSVALESVPLREVVAGAVEELSSVYAGRPLQHDCEGEGRCLADPNRLTQLIGNLVSNAMTYGAPGQPVTVRAVLDPESCSISVHNHGAPIPTELMARIFEPMERGEEALGTRSSVGLGLFIVREIAKAHAGQVAVSSNERGTTFAVTFPRR